MSSRLLPAFLFGVAMCAYMAVTGSNPFPNIFGHGNIAQDTVIVTCKIVSSTDSGRTQATKLYAIGRIEDYLANLADQHPDLHLISVTLQSGGKYDNYLVVFYKQRE
ncbi:hypothetical protein M1432_02315 [Patescibacteria group bacterium]|nr:hypothetical protein [Patescibacteria group bacterium]